MEEDKTVISNKNTTLSLCNQLKLIKISIINQQLFDKWGLFYNPGNNAAQNNVELKAADQTPSVDISGNSVEAD